MPILKNLVSLVGVILMQSQYLVGEALFYDGQVGGKMRLLEEQAFEGLYQGGVGELVVYFTEVFVGLHFIYNWEYCSGLSERIEEDVDEINFAFFCLEGSYYYMELHIGWSSESGNSVDLLREFIDHCQASSFPISSVQQLNSNINLHAGIWIFFVSTTGQGSPPYNMRPFWKQLMKKGYAINNPIEFAIYSLGDRSYGEHFGMAARKLRQRLKMLGGKEFVEIGLGDDMDTQGYREVYLNSWRDQVSSFIKEKGIVKESSGKIEGGLSLRNRNQQVEFRVEEVKELSSHKNRRTYWAKLQLLTPNKLIKQGDIVQIFPQNRQEDVAFMLNHFSKSGTETIIHNGHLLTLQELFTSHLNISFIVNYYFFVNKSSSSLINSTPNPLFRLKLQEFQQSYEEYFNFIKKYKRNIIEFIKDFELQLDFGYFVENINEIIGRKYSIARVEGRYIYLLVKLVEDQITEARLYRGLCSHDLYRGKGQVRKGRILPGQVTPAELKQNNIIITLGTGIAPFIWVLDQIQKNNNHCLLIYTNSHSDEIFHHQLVQAKQSERFSEVISCTRQGGLKMIRLLQRQAQKMYDSITTHSPSKTRIFYCGPKEIHEYLLTFLEKLLQIPIAELKKSKLIIYENW